MLIGTENSHFRKYLTTLGVSVVAASLSLAGLFLRVQDDLVIENDKLSKLTLSAQDTIRLRQSYLSHATAVLPYATLGLVALGLTFALFGLVGWRKRQEISDQREEFERDKTRVERDKTRVELEQLSESTKAQNLEEQAKQLEAVGATESESIDLRFDIYDSKQAVYSRIREIFGDKRVSTEVAIEESGNERYADIVVQAYRPVKDLARPDAPTTGFVLNIRYQTDLSSGISDIIATAALSGETAMSLWNTEGIRYVAGVVVILPDDAIIDSESVSRINARIRSSIMGLVEVVPLHRSKVPELDIGQALYNSIND